MSDTPLSSAALGLCEHGAAQSRAQSIALHSHDRIAPGMPESLWRHTLPPPPPPAPPVPEGEISPRPRPSTAVSCFLRRSLSSSIAWLDASHGATRWTVTFNLVLLRIISFNMDCHWAVQQTLPSHDSAEAKKAPRDPYRALQDTPRPLDRYDALSYFAYLFYIPLYIAGPTTTFNAWQAQMESPQVTYTKRDMGLHGLRWAAELLLMIFVLHFNYSNAIGANARNNANVLRDITLIQVLPPVFSLFIISTKTRYNARGEKRGSCRHMSADPAHQRHARRWCACRHELLLLILIFVNPFSFL